MNFDRVFYAQEKVLLAFEAEDYGQEFSVMDVIAALGG
jgi:hypothetical protein